MLVWPSAWMPAICASTSPTLPSGAVWMTQWAFSLKRHDAELVALGQRGHGAQDGLLADVDLGHAADRDAVVAVGGVAVAGVHRARLVDDHDQRDVRLALAVAHVHVDRQRFLERRALVAAGAVGVRAADHHQAAAEVAREDLQRDHALACPAAAAATSASTTES